MKGSPNRIVAVREPGSFSWGRKHEARITRGNGFGCLVRVAETSLLRGLTGSTRLEFP
jgi:hypothetical protein